MTARRCDHRTCWPPTWRAAQLQSPAFQAWGAKFHEKPMHMHRKVWEYCYVAQALAERDLLRPVEVAAWGSR